ncbi:hypothetical protein MRX96_027880 [Rhipicephalus microplus]
MRRSHSRRKAAREDATLFSPIGRSSLFPSLQRHPFPSHSTQWGTGAAIFAGEEEGSGKEKQAEEEWLPLPEVLSACARAAEAAQEEEVKF